MLTSTLRSPVRSPFQAQPRRRRPWGVEALEERTLMAVVWANAGSNNFNTVFGGTNGPIAAQIVQKAFDDWNRVLDLNWDGDDNANTNAANLQIQVSAANLGSGARGQTGNMVVDDTNRWPTSADITLDDNGGDPGWRFGNNDDFNFSNLTTPFHATLPLTGNASVDDDNDLYRTITHEIGHALGIVDIASGEYGQLRIRDYLTAVGTDQINFFSGLDRFRNAGGTYAVQATITQSGGGHFYEGAPDPSFPTEVSHPNELLNPGRSVVPPPVTRQLISDLDVQVLVDAYRYTVGGVTRGYHAIALPSQTDTFHVTRNGNTVLVRAIPGAINDTSTIATSGANVVITFDGTTERTPAANISSLTVYADGGNDTVTASSYSGGAVSYTSGVIVYGGAGNDTFTGGPANDWFFGEDGSDTFYGNGGVDRGYGGLGTDYLWGGAGNDELYGQEDNDYLYGESDNDLLYGGTGNDVAYGGYGNDTLYGDDGSDYIYGDDGNDTLYGGAGNDSAYGGAGADEIHGNAGLDYLWANNGSVYSDGAIDRLFGLIGTDGFYDFTTEGDTRTNEA